MAEYIKRETAVRTVMAAKWVDGSDGAMAMEIVASPPAANVAPLVHGRWVFGGDGCVICSKCNEEESNNNHRNYCPNCGAIMDGGADHEAD